MTENNTPKLDKNEALKADAARWRVWVEAIAALDDSEKMPPLFTYLEENFSHLKCNVTIEQVNAVTDLAIAEMGKAHG